MSKKLRFVALLMVFAILSCRLCIVNVNAAEGVTSNAAVTQLSGLRITDLSKPVAGRTLDFKARIRTNENVTWEIPVIWTDDLGNTVYQAEPGRKYTPHFVFFVPEGYTVEPDRSSGQIDIKLPDFVSQIYNGAPVVFVADASKGIMYISPLPSFFEAATSSAADAAKAEIYKAPAIAPDNAVPVIRSDDSGKDNGRSSGSGGANAPVKDDKDELPEQVRIHCSPGAYNLIDHEALNELVTLVKNKLEPQAVNLLKNSFPAYLGAAAGELGTQIGLYVYYERGAIDNGSGGTVASPGNALAYVSGGYFSEQGEDGVFKNVYKYVLALDTEAYMEQDPATGKWQMKENEKNNFENTIVHEMMHAFMDDYTRRGMVESADGFPEWFKEGLASAMENVYQYRAYLFQTLGNENNSAYSNELGRYTNNFNYSEIKLYTKYTDSNLTGNNRYDLAYSNTEENTGSAYVSGYLAVVYLGYLAAVRDGHTGIVTPGNTQSYPPVSPTVNIDEIRYGTGRILELLHEGYSLDSVIRFISASEPNDGSPYYNGADDFAERFIKGENEQRDDRNIYVGENNTMSNVMGSRSFCTNYLNYLESKSEEGDYTKLANGSILKSAQGYVTPLDRNGQDTQSDLYRILDSQSYIASSVENSVAYDNTGGKSSDHNQDDGQVEYQTVNGGESPAPVIVIGEVDDEEAAAAAKQGIQETGVPDTSDPVTQEPASAVVEPSVTEQVAEESVAEAVAEVVPEPVPVPGIEPDAAVPAAELSPDMEFAPEPDTFVILPQDEDALVPEYSEPVAEAAPVPDGDGGASSDPEPSSDSDSDSGSDNDSGSGSDDSDDTSGE